MALILENYILIKSMVQGLFYVKFMFLSWSTNDVL